MALPQPPAEIRIATALAADRGDHPDIARFADVLVDGFDWQGFIRILRFHRLEIQVASQMQMLPADCVPPDVARELAMLALQARAHSRAMVSELLRLVQLFRSANLDLLCFKGPATAQRLRGDPGCRTARDLDLLIRGEDASAAVDLLMSNGYSLAAEHVEMPLTAERLDSIQGWMSNIAFRNADHGIVELHWRLFRRRSEFPLEMEKLWNGSQTIQIGDTPVRVMNGAIEAIYLALHGSKHGWKRLHWLLDIHWMMCNAETDWEEILQISRDLGVARSASEAVVLSNRVYGSGLPMPCFRIRGCCARVKGSPGSCKTTGTERRPGTIPPGTS